MLTENHALAPLPVEAQRIIAASGCIRTRRALVSSMHLHPGVARVLSNDRDTYVRKLALRRSDDRDAVNAAITNSKLSAVHAARNPNADPSVLSSALHHRYDEVVAAALVNPSTPEEERRQLPIRRIIEVCEVGDPIGNRVVRTHETLIANLWLLDHLEEFNLSFRRAALALPQIDAKQFKALTAAGWNKFAAVHPLRSGVTLEGAPTEAMLLTGSPAVDLYVTNHPETTLSMARTLYGRHWRLMVEPHVLARLFQRFGESLLVGQQTTVLSRLAVTRVNSTAWSEPHFAFYSRIIQDQGRGTEEMRQVVELLGTNPEAWESFFRLEGGWEQTPVELAEAVLAL